MDRRKQLERDVFFNLATPPWQGYPLKGRAHFRSRSLTSVSTGFTDDFPEPDAFSFFSGQPPMAMLDGRERLYQVFRTFDYPCQLNAKRSAM
ncbi:hypothetical protein [Pseudomonas sp. RT6P73]